MSSSANIVIAARFAPGLTRAMRDIIIVATIAAALAALWAWAHLHPDKNGLVCIMQTLDGECVKWRPIR
jgi:hypothetical protein